jgi:hypothetical protein
LGDVHPPEERDHPVGVLLLEVVVDVEERVADQFHPQLFDLVHDLKLHLVGVAEVSEVFLAGQQPLGVEVDLIVKGALAVHDGIEMFSIQGSLPTRG